MNNWQGKQYSFFTHAECEFFPCHDGIAAVDFNCLFCYCPLYFTDCEGVFTFTSRGVKDCSDCTFPHKRDNYGAMMDKLRLPNERRTSQ